MLAKERWFASSSVIEYNWVYTRRCSDGPSKVLPRKVLPSKVCTTNTRLKRVGEIRRIHTESNSFFIEIATRTLWRVLISQLWSFSSDRCKNFFPNSAFSHQIASGSLVTETFYFEASFDLQQFNIGLVRPKRKAKFKTDYIIDSSPIWLYAFACS